MKAMLDEISTMVRPDRALPVEPHAMPAQLRSATRRFGNVVALDGIDLEVRPGELVALLGPNGAGKTTAISLLLGLGTPDSGRAELFGRPPRDIAARRRIGAMLQDAQLEGRTRVGEMVALQSGYYPNPLPLAETLAIAGLDGLCARAVGKLSGGEKRRLLFALAICGDPELLFLDEPSAGMDVESRQGLWAAVRRLKQRGRSIVLTTHYLEEADALADRIVVIGRGRVIAEGTPESIKRKIAQRHIRCVTALDAGVLRRLPGVTSVTRDGARLDVVAAAPERVLREMLTRDPGLHDLEVTGARLEEAFLALTGETREAA